MSSLPRFLLSFVLFAALLAGGATAARAQQTPQDKAEQLNQEGQALFKQQDFNGAAQKFREAILFSPEGRFYFNLCYTLNKAGQYRDAITACENVDKYQASNPLKEKARELLEALREHVKNTNQDPNYVPPDNTNNGGGNNGDGGNNGGGADNGGGGNAPPPPAPGGVVEKPAAPPLGHYKWAVGGELGGVRTSVGDSDLYARAAPQFRLHADFILSEAHHFGLQPYLQITPIGPNPDSTDDYNMSIVDLGGALYQHHRISDRLWWHWLGGVHLSLINPDQTIGSDAIATFGGRAQGGISYLLGDRGQHVLTANVDFNLYLPGAGGTSGLVPADYGLDSAGASFGINVGYTMRFDQPFGSAPVFTLE